MKNEVSDEAYAVYSAVLDEQYGSWFKGKNGAVIVPHTVLEPQGHPGYKACRQTLGQVELWQGLFDKMVNEKEEFRIEPRLTLPGKYAMQARQESEGSVVFFSFCC